MENCPILVAIGNLESIRISLENFGRISQIQKEPVWKSWTVA